MFLEAAQERGFAWPGSSNQSSDPVFWELHIAVKKGLLIAVENLQIIRRHRNFGFFLIEPHDIGIF